MTDHPQRDCTFAVLLALALLAFCLVAPTVLPKKAYAQDVVDTWRPGDVHVHAAGDSGLGSHVRCQVKPEDITCANYLVRETHKRARTNGIDWMIYTEHVPWLGIHPHEKRICVPAIGRLLPLCKTVVFPRNDPEQAQQQYDELRDATTSISTQPKAVRGLMGQELGTAAQITVPLAWTKQLRDADYDEIAATLGPEKVERVRRAVTPRLPDGVPFGDTVNEMNEARTKAAVEAFVHAVAASLRTALDQAVGPIPCLDQGVKSGHFAVYSQGDAIPDNVYACDEDVYLNDVGTAAAWGGVNHPDNADGGSRWYCWAAGDARPLDLTGSRLDGSVDGPVCSSGVTERESIVRSLEIINDRNMPTTRSLRQIDSLLLQGKRIALVGGGDAHTARPDGKLTAGTVSIGPLDIPLPNLGLGRQQSGNDGKIGLSGRTWLPLTERAVSRPFDATDQRDPVRLAIAQGRTVASTGPLGLPRLGDKLPGDTATIGRGPIKVRVDFRPAAVVAGDGVVDRWEFDGDPQVVPVRHVGTDDAVDLPGTTSPADLPGLPEKIVVVVGRSNVCPGGPNTWDHPCVTDPVNLLRTTYRVTEADRERQYAVVPVDVPPNLAAGFLRTETLYAPLAEGGDRFDDGQQWNDGAFSSPIWLLVDPFAAPPTALGEACAQAAIPPPVGVLGPVSCLWSVQADLDGNRRPDRLAVWRRTTGDSLLDIDQDNGAVAYLDDGSYHFLEDPTQQWAEPAETFTPASVVDTNGDGRQEVVIRTLVGANTEHFTLLTVTPDQRLHAIRFPDGEVRFLTAGGGAGSGSGFGCAVSEGRRLLITVGYISDSSIVPYGYAYEWVAVAYRLDGAAAVEVGRFTGYRSDGAPGQFAASIGANGCMGELPDIGPI